MILAIIALIIAVIALVLAIILFIWFISLKTTVTNQGIAWIVQVGTTTSGQTTDTMQTGGNNFYIGYPSNDLVLKLAANNSNVEGSTIEIFNGSTNTIAIVPDSGVNLLLLSIGDINSNIVEAGGLAILIATGRNAWLRVQ